MATENLVSLDLFLEYILYRLYVYRTGGEKGEEGAPMRWEGGREGGSSNASVEEGEGNGEVWVGGTESGMPRTPARD